VDGIATTACCSGFNTDIIAVGFETGEIVLLKLKSDNVVETLAKLDNYYNLPSLSMAVIHINLKNILVIGYLNGEIRLHNLSSNYELMLSLGAHLRLITHVSAYNDYFITCGDDCYVNIWKLDKDDKILNKGNFELCDKMPVGACVLERENTGNTQILDLLVSVYDSSNLVLIQNISI
jgi:WD40 repeat protein